MPDLLHPMGQPSSEKGQDRMMQAKIPEIHIHKASQRNFFFSSAHMPYPAGLCALHGGRKNRGCRLSQRLLCLAPLPTTIPCLSPTPQSSCSPRHTVASTLSTRQGHLSTLLNVSKFHSVFLFSYNKVESLCLTPLWLPLSLLPLPPCFGCFSAISIKRSPLVTARR